MLLVKAMFVEPFSRMYYIIIFLITIVLELINFSIKTHTKTLLCIFDFILVMMTAKLVSI